MWERVGCSFDVLSPLKHEMTYQAALADWLGIERSVEYAFTNKVGKKDKKDVILDEKDEVWREKRHLHIMNCAEIQAEQQLYVQENKAFVDFQEGKGEMVDPHQYARFQRKYELYSLNGWLISQLYKTLKEKDILKIALLEEKMALGVDEVEKTVRAGELVSDLVHMMHVGERHVKMRLLMMFIISQEGIKPSVRKQLMEAAELEDVDDQAVMNLRHLGVPLDKASTMRKLSSLIPGSSGSGNRPRDMSMPDGSHYVCEMKSLVSELCQQRLSATDYPSVKDPIGTGGPTSRGGGGKGRSLRASRHRPHWAGEQSEKKGSRVFVFVVGGIAYSEMRAVYEVAKATGQDVVIGSTSIVTPNEFVDQLAQLESPPEEF